MRIGVARLRSRVHYRDPLSDILDSYYYLLQRFLNDNKHLNTHFYNISFNHQPPTRNPQELEECSHIIIPSENEFHYHIPNYIHTLDLQKSNQHVKDLGNYLQNKTLIILSSDKADSIDLYTKYVFPTVSFKNIYLIDENDFAYGVHALKYYFITESQLMSTTKTHDFAYWGTSKRKTIGGRESGDQRHIVLRDIKRSSLQCCFIGRFDNFKADIKFSKQLKTILPYLLQSRSTLCFQWPDFNKYTTARFHEAIACDIIPFVWDDYDKYNTLVTNQYQRCTSSEMLIEKVMELRNEKFYTTFLKEIKDAYLDLIPSKEQQYDRFVWNIAQCGVY